MKTRRKRHIFNRFLEFTASLYLANTLALPIAYTYITPIDFEQNISKVRLSMGTDQYIYGYEGDEEEVALKYLKLAHAITMKHISYSPNPPYDIDGKLERGLGDCSETAEFTYENFIILTRASGNHNLSKLVRFVFGRAEISESNSYHSWIEIKQNGGWVPYETTSHDLADDTCISPEEIDSLIPTEQVLNRDDVDYTLLSTSQIDSRKDNTKRKLHIFNSLTDYRGLIGGILDRIRLSK